MVDIFAVKPHQVSKDLKGYALMFYGEPKSGKTTTAAKFPKSLLLAFEKGYNAIPGVLALPMNTWSDFKQVLRQLDSEEARATYDNIIVDTADIAAELAEKYISNQNQVATIADIPFGKGYGLVEKELDANLRKIMQMGYGLILISHSQDKTFTDESGTEYNQIVPTLDKRANKIVTRMADIIGYSRSVVNPETEQEEVRLFMRGTPRFTAGSRFPDVPEVDYVFPSSIVFNYNNLVNTIADAVAALEKGFGVEAVTTTKSNAYQYKTVTTPVEDLVKEFNQIAGELMNENKDYYGPRIVDIVNENLGHGAKISEALPKQAELVDSALTQLKELAATNK